MKRPTGLNIVDRDQMSLLGLMLGSIIENNLSSPKGAALARRLRGKLGVTAGRMSLTLEFDNGSIKMILGEGGGLKASVHGSLDSLLKVALGEGIIRPFLSGEVSFSGNPFFLLKALPLFYANRDIGERA